MARTIVLTDSVFANVDAEGAPIGLEFVSADAFIPFLRERASNADLPPQIRGLFRLTGA